MVESETEKKAVVAVLERLGAAWSELDARALADVFTAEATMIAFGYLRKAGGDRGERDPLHLGAGQTGR
ncbi:hypothetical protein [Streptomyces rugosispiralis]|uniref:Uncharacterized protein n=1 Tax=Streptomyces rugosispiralis TaxID=2967341 RepID=A0ABT1UY70_9ACTN|nr:hypothetical protein [Streptomyces rugosispiralis]MCQ8190068.1 hypothetical protein [Streptomyces rugosispiralis]